MIQQTLGMKIFLYSIFFALFFVGTAQAITVITEYSYGVANASQYWGVAGYYPWLAFDHNYANEDKWTTADVATAPHWLMMDYGLNPHAINNYSILAQSPGTYQQPTAWQLEGSNDDFASRIVIDAQSGQTLTAGSWYNYKNGTINGVSFRYYRLLITDSSNPGGNPIGLNELSLYNDSTITAPVASFNANPMNGTSPLAVTITDTSENTPTSWDYTIKGYGSNSTVYANASTEQNPSFTFLNGNYTITLIATNLDGSGTSAPVWINVSLNSPTADFLGFPRYDCYPLNVSFTDLSMGYLITSWFWDFGDGTNSTLQNPYHIYSSSNLFDVSLNVTNSSGSNTLIKYSYVDTTHCPTPTPTPPPQQWCGAQDLFFDHDQSSDPLGYEQLLNFPDGNPEVDENVTLRDTFGYVPIDQYITPIGLPNINLIEYGAWRFRTYDYVSTTVGNTTLNFTVYKYDQTTALQTYLFSIESADINDLTVTEILTGYASSTNFTLLSTDRLVIKVSGKTDHSSNVFLHFVYQGFSHASHVNPAYFICPIVPTPTPTPIPTPTTIGPEPTRSTFSCNGNVTSTSILWDIAPYVPYQKLYLDGIDMTAYYPNSSIIVQSGLGSSEKHTLSVISGSTEYTTICETTASEESRQQGSVIAFLTNLNEWIYLIVILPLLLYGLKIKASIYSTIILFIASGVSLYALATWLIDNPQTVTDIWHLQFFVYGFLFLLGFIIWVAKKR